MHTVADIAAAGGQATYVRADLTDEDDVGALFSAIRSTSGNLHVLVNNAGHTIPTDFASASAEHWLEQFRTNFVSAALCSQQAAKLMLGSGGGVIVNVASIRGLPEGVRPGIMAYGAAKAALIHLTKALARQLAPTIRVNAVAPGVVETPYLETVEAPLIEQWRASIPLGRFLTTDEVADAVLFVIQAKGMTGEIVVLDCGATL
jgi:NAD(P)-dependent dehydrogenase (short-subunit alcohol dehydrogenase family)